MKYIMKYYKNQEIKNPSKPEESQQQQNEQPSSLPNIKYLYLTKHRNYYQFNSNSGFLNSSISKFQTSSLINFSYNQNIYSTHAATAAPANTAARITGYLSNTSNFYDLSIHTRKQWCPIRIAGIISSASPEFKRFNDLKKTINDIANSNPTTPGTATTLAKRSQTPDSSYSNQSGGGGNSSNKENSRSVSSKEQIVSVLRDPNSNANTNGNAITTLAAPNSKNLPSKLSTAPQKLNKVNSSIEFNETFQNNTNNNNNNGISNNNLPVNHRKQQQQQQQQQTMATSETLLITNNQRSSIISENSTLSSQTTTNTSNTTTTQRLNVNLTTLKSLAKPQLTQSGITRLQQQGIGSSSSSNSSNSASNTPNYHLKSITNNNDTETQANNNQNSNDDAMSTSQQQVILVKTIHPSNRFANGHLTPINTNDFNNKSNSNIAASNTQMFNSSVSLSSININRSTNNSTIGTPGNNSSSSNNINNSSNNNNTLPRRMNKSVTVANGINTQTGYLNSSNSNLSSQFNGLSMNNNNFTASNSNLNVSPLKHNSTVPLFQSKKFTEEYRQGMQFDYSDPFQSCSQEFLSRVSEMHRLQMDTIEWERKKKLTKKKPKVAATNSNTNAVAVAANND